MNDRVRVLLVDDQAPFREAAKAVLNLLDEFELVAEAESGEDALRLAEEVHPDLVIMDIHLPKMDGLEGTRRSKEADLGRVVLLVSTHDASEQESLIQASGADAFIPKDAFGRATLRSAWLNAG